ncbi:hypothetical protein [Rhizobium leguminosarum]|uniref:hypothetical protein n=1 Tax=Rhizobium leguminosarum TaxID=384 RepID=UPI0014417E44|nr:hypothetical protein [Rhizobium leguminosarum]NKL63311.1 hypothetical protein [Rhizobium leguminosarum bv. viciae]
MSSIDEKETNHAMGDDRDFFEEDFVQMVPGSFVELPEGYNVSIADLPDDAGTGHLFPAFLSGTRMDRSHPLRSADAPAPTGM